MRAEHATWLLTSVRNAVLMEAFASKPHYLWIRGCSCILRLAVARYIIKGKKSILGDGYSGS
jgi:hypothetical protein